MIAIVSPAKSLDFESQYDVQPSQPRVLDKTEKLIEVMRSKEVTEVKKLMSISDKLAQLNVERYHAYSPDHNQGNAKPCVLAFQGDVYQGLKAEELDPESMDFAQKHFRILSGLYGLLRPLDLIQPYRLEMGTKLAFDDYKTLYDYWSDKITGLLNEDLAEQGDDILLNLASVEYFTAVDRKKLKGRIIDVEFKDLKDDQYKIISFYAKKARGYMSRYFIDHRVQDPQDLRDFNYEGYYFDPSESSDDKLAFKRDGKPQQ